MLKKNLLIIALLASNAYFIDAVLLKDGSNFPYEMVIKIWNKIQVLKNQGDNITLARLSRACAANNVKAAEHILSSLTAKNSYAEDIAKLKKMNFCDKDGNFNVITRHVVKSSISVTYKGILPLWVNVSSPISWKNWTTMKYWLGKN